MDEKSQGLRTLTGIPYADLPALLDAELPASAYKAVPGGADLTDISPAHMRKVLNTIFGLSGYGWGYNYESQDMTTFSEMREGSRGERLVIVATLKHLRFWYRLVDSVGNVQLLCQIDASGGSENANAGYAMKGAITNALGNAVSNLGFQESVYMGERSHHDFEEVRRAAEKEAAVAKATAAKAALAGNKPAATPAPAKPVAQVLVKPAPVQEPEIEELDADVAAPVAKANPGDYVIPTGKYIGMKMADVDRKVVEFYATKLAISNDDTRTLRAAAVAFLAQAS